MTAAEFTKEVYAVKKAVMEDLLKSQAGLTQEYCALIWLASACREGVKRLEGLSEEEIQQLEQVYQESGKSTGADGSKIVGALTDIIKKLQPSAPTPQQPNGTPRFGGRLGDVTDG